MIVDVVDQILLCSFVSGDQAEVISVRGRHVRNFTEFVTFVRIHLQLLENRIEHEQEDHRADGIALKNSSFKGELIGSPFAGLDNRT